MTLEEQFLNSEKKRLEAEEQKRRADNGLPSLEEEAIANALKEQQTKDSMPTLVNIAEFIKDTNMRVDELNTKLRLTLENQQTEIDTLNQSVKNLSDIIYGELVPLVTVTLKKRSQNDELEKETLTILKQYLKDWV